MEYTQEIKKIINEYKENKPIGMSLIMNYGDLNFSHLLYEQSDSIIYNYVTKATQSISEDDKAVVIAAITLIAIEDYDANIWNHISQRFSKSFNENSLKNKSVVLIKSILESCPTYDPSLRYVSVPLKQAAVPLYWLQRYFAFCQDIYKHNLLFRYSDDIFVKNKFSYIFEQLKAKQLLTNDDEGTHILLSNNGGHQEKTYYLSRYTKQLINSRDSLETLLEISCICTRAINDENIELPLFFKQAFLEWKKKNKKGLDEERERVEREGKIITAPRFVMEFGVDDNPFVLLETDTVSIPNPKDYSEEELFVVVKSGDQIIADQQIEYYDAETFGEVSVNSKRFVIDNPFANISYMIAHKNSKGEVDDVLYPSNGKPRLMRIPNDVMFYDYKKRRIVHENSNYGYGDLYAICKNEQSIYSEACVRNNGYYVYFLNVTPSRYFRIDGRNLCFKKIGSIGLNGNLNERVSFQYNESNVDVYSILEELIIETEITNDCYLIYDDKKTDCEIDVENIDENIKRINYKLSFLKNGYHILSVITNSKTLYSQAFVLDQSLKVHNTDNNSIAVNSDFYSFEKNFKDGDSEIEYFVNYEEISGTIHIKTFKFGFSYDGSSWDCASTVAVYEFMQSDAKLYITGIKNNKALAIVSGGSREEENDTIVGQKTAEGNYCFDISLIDKFKFDFYSIVLVFDYEEKTSKTLTVNYFTDVKMLIEYDKEQDINTFTASFKTSHPIMIEFVPNNGKYESFKIGPISSLSKTNIPKLSAFIDYNIYAMENIGSGHYKRTYLRKYSFSSVNRIDGLSFNIEKVYYIKTEEDEDKMTYGSSVLETRMEISFVKSADFYIGILKITDDVEEIKVCYILLEFIGDFNNGRAFARITQTQSIKSSTKPSLKFNLDRKVIVTTYEEYEKKSLRDIDIIEISKK